MSEKTPATAPSALFVQSKQVPACLSAVIQSLKTQNSSVVCVDRLEKANDVIAKSWSGLVVVCVSENLEILPLLNFLKQNQTRIKSQQLRVVAFSLIDHSKVTALLQSKGCAELLDYKLQPKTFLFKAEKHFKFIKNSTNAEQASFIPATPEIGEQPPLQEQPAFKVQLAAAITGGYDYWWIRKKTDVRKVFDRWSVELIGPSPSVGSWEKTHQAIWCWKVKSKESPFYSEEGEWAFFGEKPEFVWTENRWRFRAEKPILGFFKDGKALAFRFRIDTHGTVHVTENSPSALVMREQIVATFNQDFSLTADKAKTGSIEDFFKGPEERDVSLQALDVAPEDLSNTSDFLDQLPQGAEAFKPLDFRDKPDSLNAAERRQDEILDFLDQVKGARANSTPKNLSDEQIAAQESVFLDFMKQTEVLIVDAEKSGDSKLVEMLEKMGAKPAKIVSVATFAEAKEIMKTRKPKLVLCDYRVGNDTGLDLITDQRSHDSADKMSDSVFVLMTHNASQSAVAHAAEEDVDTYIVKPGSASALKTCLRKAVISKLYPSPYIQAIHEGKQKIRAKEYKSAISLLTKALEMDYEPALACYYIGQAEEAIEAFDRAEASYKTGLSFNPIHFKCLAGLFELLQLLRRSPDAYEVIHSITRYFPANAKRLNAALRLAIVTNSFKHMEYYYDLYKRLEPKTEEVTRYAFAALSVTGRYHLQNKTKQRAIEAFNRAADLSGQKPSLLRYVIETLEEFGQLAEAEPFLQKFLEQDRASSDYLISDFIILATQLDAEEAVSTARRMIQQGIESSGLYRVLIQKLIKAGKVDEAVEQSKIAQQKWPQNANRFVVSVG
jgi:CheY-like chemotaxis protein/Tfp pilus assembly protein PilF